MLTNCPKCTKQIEDSYPFCPFCGFKNERPNATLTGRQKAKIYIFSFLLAPFGLIWFFKYVRSPDSNNRKIAYSVLIITIIAVSISAIVLKSYVTALTNYKSLYESNMGIYSF